MVCCDCHPQHRCVDSSGHGDSITTRTTWTAAFAARLSAGHAVTNMPSTCEVCGLRSRQRLRSKGHRHGSRFVLGQRPVGGAPLKARLARKGWAPMVGARWGGEWRYADWCGGRPWPTRHDTVSCRRGGTANPVDLPMCYFTAAQLCAASVTPDCNMTLLEPCDLNSTQAHRSSHNGLHQATSCCCCAGPELLYQLVLQIGRGR